MSAISFQWPSTLILRETWSVEASAVLLVVMVIKENVTYVVVDARFAIFHDHALAHVEPVKENARRCQSELRQFEQYPSLDNKVYTLRSAATFFCDWEAV